MSAGTPRILAWLEDPPADRGIRFAADAGDSWTFWGYDRLARRCRRAAHGLAGLGVVHGDVVTIIQRPGPDFVATLFGALLAGAIPSPVAPPLVFQDPHLYEHHVRGLLAAARPAIIVTEDDLIGRVAALSADCCAARAVTAGRVIPGEDDAAQARGEYKITGRRQGDLALIQFTSGSSGHARGVRVTYEALECNVAAIQRWLAMTQEDATATWLPVHHDMGLIGCLVTPILNASDIWLMEPEQFIRAPDRYLGCFGSRGARLTAMPSFGLDYIARRVRPEMLAGLDFSEWRALIVGAERIADQTMDAFCRLLGPYGFARRSLLPAYGLAEATLAVTGLPLAEEPVAVCVDPGSLVLGAPVRIVPDSDQAQPVVGCGKPLAGVTVEIADESGEIVPPGHVGEIVAGGRSVTAGYLSGTPASPTSFAGGRLRTGDAGFVLDGQLFVLGRLGDSMKVRGRTIFAEDLEAGLESAGLPRHRMAVLLGVHAGLPTAVAVVEDAAAQWLADAAHVLRRKTGGARIVLLDVPRGTIERTSSGKPKRRVLWARFTTTGLPGDVHADCSEKA